MNTTELITRKGACKYSIKLTSLSNFTNVSWTNHTM